MADVWQLTAEEYARTTWREMHPLLRGLFEQLPAPGSTWSYDERKRWLAAAASMFALLYESQADLEHTPHHEQHHHQAADEQAY